MILGILLTVFCVVPAIPAEEMPPEQLQDFLMAWDDTFNRADFPGLSKLMHEVTVSVQDPFFGSTHKLRYSNDEVEDRVLLLYRVVCQSILRQSFSSRYNFLLSEDEDGDLDLPFEIDPLEPLIPGEEATADFHEYLANVAESTLNPRIYWYVWGCMFPNNLSPYYLARVKPEITLALLLEANEHEHSSRLLGLKHGMASTGMKAMQILTLIALHSPEIALAEADRIVEFIQQYSFEFERDEETVARSGYAGNDYVLRIQALDLLELVGTKDDLHVVERLKKNAPDYTRSFIGGWRMAHPLPDDLTVEQRAQEVARSLESKNAESQRPAESPPE